MAPNERLRIENLKVSQQSTFQPFTIEGANTWVESDYLYSEITNEEVRVTGPKTLKVIREKIQIRTDTRRPKVGLLMVGWGGNNGSTVTAGLLANKHNINWRTRRGLQAPNYYGSLLLAATMNLGIRDDTEGEFYVPFKDVLPLADPEEFVVWGWDISGMDLARAMDRAQVLEPDLVDKLRPEMEKMVPWRSVYYPDFIAGNQRDRADNVLPGKDKSEHLAQLRRDIRVFKQTNDLDTVVVVWTANTERFSKIIPGVNDTADAILAAIASSHPEVSASVLFAVASILEGAVFINGSPQNTFLPGVLDLATQKGAFIAGDDFKSGQTKLKSVLVDFLVGAGMKPVAIASYNHLGNNDGKNLSEAAQFEAKEVSKTNVVTDMVSSNQILYPDVIKSKGADSGAAKGKDVGHVGPDHLVVIKYIPSVGDSKRALDEYETEIFLGGRNTISVHNVCEDSLLAAPLILDLVLMAELLTRIEVKKEGEENFRKFNSVLSLLSFMLKAPLVPQGRPIINALFKQRSAIENLFRAAIGLPPVNALALNQRL